MPRVQIWRPAAGGGPRDDALGRIHNAGIVRPSDPLPRVVRICRMQLQTPKQEDPVGDLTRRGFVKNSAVTAAGMTAIGAIAAADASADSGAAGSEPVVA